ncbi:MAG: NAD-dependent epimerase/dehydratase family protein [Candidatus Cloacimonetes bacterium]|jgi:UDP-glucose 4-epimerase|nr:NAD-dependent epimerase/dehydratase family protein [Candidatus Cloacimonadota bacterium]MDD4099992.1 NAD-dependent epimerase/dehydratase family protein [Candidatus Cloacimonadota bacterium]MDD4805695.1 NAD-dependent epimerase/dehydratase family protein [Candidatus Cloacimonadota bacterium]
MKILITGAAGFIASHVADAFVEAGHDVVIVDNFRTGYPKNLNPKARFYELDICDPRLEYIFAKEKPDVVDHHAAQISVPLSVEDPLTDAEINVKGLINILENCVKHQVKKVIYISSGGAMYGEATEYPTSETYNPKPLSVYAINKMVGENYLYFYQKTYGLDYTVLRYANVFGPRQVSHGEAGVVSIFVEKLLAEETPTLNVYPEEPDGMIRDYVYVKDVVAANLAALNKGSGEAFNIGTCIETSTRALFNEICRQMRLQIEPKKGAARKGDLRRSLLKIDKAKEELGWEPRYTLAEGISEVIYYFKLQEK